MQAMESMSSGVGQQEAFGSCWPSPELRHEPVGEGRKWPPDRSRIIKGLVLSAKKWKLSLTTYREPLKGCMQGADRIS